MLCTEKVSFESCASAQRSFSVQSHQRVVRYLSPRNSRDLHTVKCRMQIKEQECNAFLLFLFNFFNFGMPVKAKSCSEDLLAHSRTLPNLDDIFSIHGSSSEIPPKILKSTLGLQSCCKQRAPELEKQRYAQ